MSKKKQIVQEEPIRRIICYCKKCINGQDVKNHLVLCKIQNNWNHSPVNCPNYVEK